MEILSQLELLPRARRFVRNFCQTDTCRPLTWEDLWQLELAVHEVAANIIRHAYGNRTDQPIMIEIEGFEKRITVRLNHWGKPFTQPKSTPPPVIDGTVQHGFGLYLIEQCVDRVIYGVSPNGKNTISLLKQVKD
jgi:anti-sigma regulatory factor (Ser/Thr protein kinase)